METDTEPAWLPVNVAEQLIAEAVDRDDLATALGVLVAATLYLPGAAPGIDGALALLAEGADGHTYVPAFTSLTALSAYPGVAADTYAITTCAELVEVWPDPAWRLAVNPHTPVSIDLAGDDLVALVAEAAASPTGGAAGNFLAGNGTERMLHAAITDDDPERLLDALVPAWVLVPVEHPVDGDVGPGDARFPWRRFEVDGGPAILPFTSLDRLVETFRQPGPVAAARFVEVLRAWPSPTDALVLNVGTAIEVATTTEERDELIRLARTVVTLADPPRPGLTIDDLAR